MNNEFPRPKIFCSLCLHSQRPWRYDGEPFDFPFLKKLAKYADITALCPEMEAGLGVPRSPVRVVETAGFRRLVQPQSGLDITAEMSEFSRVAAFALGGTDGFILKSRSPSCGLNGVKAFDSADAAEPCGKTKGFFAAEILRRFPRIPAADEVRLARFASRDRFLTAVFALADFRAASSRDGIGGVVDFHSRYKYLLMACDQNAMRSLGAVAANRTKRPVEEIFEEYFEGLKSVLARGRRRGEAANALEHVFGYFKNKLSSAEKAAFLTQLEKYRKGRRSFRETAAVLRGFAGRAGGGYINGQTLFAPYPVELAEL